MYSHILLSKSPRADKKYRVILPNNERVDFGATGYEDYTTHKDPNRKERYLLRHAKNENWNDPFSAGFWSRWLLWNKPSLEESIEDIEGMLKIKILTHNI